MMGGLRGIVKYLRSSGAVFVYVLVIYFLLMVHQVADNADNDADNDDNADNHAVNADYADNAAPHRLRSHFLLMIHRIVDNIQTGFQFGRIHKISKV